MEKEHARVKSIFWKIFFVVMHVTLHRLDLWHFARHQLECWWSIFLEIHITKICSNQVRNTHNDLRICTKHILILFWVVLVYFFFLDFLSLNLVLWFWNFHEYKNIIEKWQKISKIWKKKIKNRSFFISKVTQELGKGLFPWGFCSTQ